MNVVFFTPHTHKVQYEYEIGGEWYVYEQLHQKVISLLNFSDDLI